MELKLKSGKVDAIYIIKDKDIIGFLWENIVDEAVGHFAGKINDSIAAVQIAEGS